MVSFHSEHIVIFTFTDWNAEIDWILGSIDIVVKYNRNSFSLLETFVSHFMLKNCTMEAYFFFLTVWSRQISIWLAYPKSR